FFSRYPASSYIFALSLHDALPIFQNGAGVARVALAKNVGMAPEEFVGDLRNDVVDGKSPGFARDLGVHHHQQQEIAKFFLKMRVDRKSTRLNSSHVSISYAVFCLK